jgi:hypothetical protein
MVEIVKNLMALVDIHHLEHSVTRQRPKVIPKGIVVSRDAFLPVDVKHFLQNGHMEETDAPVTAEAAPAPDMPTQSELVAELDQVEAQDGG